MSPQFCVRQSAVSGRFYRVFGYKGKQVRDNIPGFDLVEAFVEFSHAPRSGEVYNIGGSRHSNCPAWKFRYSLRDILEEIHPAVIQRKGITTSANCPRRDDSPLHSITRPKEQINRIAPPRVRLPIRVRLHFPPRDFAIAGA
jgi:hypothetical protein